MENAYLGHELAQASVGALLVAGDAHGHLAALACVAARRRGVLEVNERLDVGEALLRG